MVLLHPQKKVLLPEIINCLLELMMEWLATAMPRFMNASHPNWHFHECREKCDGNRRKVINWSNNIRVAFATDWYIWRIEEDKKKKTTNSTKTARFGRILKLFEAIFGAGSKMKGGRSYLKIPMKIKNWIYLFIHCLISRWPSTIKLQFF